MKKHLSVLLAAAMLAALTGCSGNQESVPSSDTSSQADPVVSSADESTSSEPDTSSAPAESESSAPEVTVSTAEESSQADVSSAESEPEEDTRTDYEKMVDRSLLSTGNMTRMANVLQRAQGGEDITVAYIGGSITVGYNAGTTEFYAKTCTDWLQSQLPDCTVTGVNAGISGTPSLLGNLRLERDVLAYDPDIVFVEFAVNDGQEEEYKDAYESLVRTLLTQDRDIAVVLLFTVLDNGYTCQEHMSQIGANYDLPMISVPDSVYAEIEAGRMTWQDYSNDQSHPNEYGHKCITDFVSNYYSKVFPNISASVGAVDKDLPQPVFSGKYANMHYMDSQTMQVTADGFNEYNTHENFQNGWMYRGDTGASLSFTVNCSVLEMVFKANNSATFANADIYVDGVKTSSVESNREDGWNNPVTAYLIDEDSSAEHTVEVRVPEEKGAFFVLAFGYCD